MSRFEQLREAGEQNPHLEAGPITELEMFARYRGLMMPREIALLERLGYVRDGEMTRLGREELARRKKKP